MGLKKMLMLRKGRSSNGGSNGGGGDPSSSLTTKPPFMNNNNNNKQGNHKMQAITPTRKARSNSSGSSGVPDAQSTPDSSHDAEQDYSHDSYYPQAATVAAFAPASVPSVPRYNIQGRRSQQQHQHHHHHHHQRSTPSIPQQLHVIARNQDGDDDDDDVSSIHVGESVHSPPRRRKGSDQSKSELNLLLPRASEDENDSNDNNNDDEDMDELDLRKLLHTPPLPTAAAAKQSSFSSTSSPDSILSSSWMDNSKIAMDRFLSFGSDNSRTVMDQLLSSMTGADAQQQQSHPSQSQSHLHHQLQQNQDDNVTVFLPATGEASSIVSQPSCFSSIAGTTYTERAGNVTKKKDVLTTLICLSLLECGASNCTTNNNNNNTTNNSEVEKSDDTFHSRDSSSIKKRNKKYKNNIYLSIPERIVRESLRRHLELSLSDDLANGRIQQQQQQQHYHHQQRSSSSTKSSFLHSKFSPPRQQHQQQKASSSTSSPQRRKSLPVNVDDALFESDDPVVIANYVEQCLARQDYAEAIDIYRALWKRQREAIAKNGGGGGNLGSMAHTLTKLALLNLLIGRLELAMKYSKGALKIYRQESRPGQIAMCLMEVGMIYFGANRLGPALKSWREALHLIYKAMGYDNAHIPILLNNIGCLHLEAGDLTASIRTLEESLDLQRTALSASTSDTNVCLIHMATTMSNIAMVSARRFELEIAIGLLEEARALQESVLPEQHALIQLTTSTLDRIVDMRDGVLAHAPAATFAFHLFKRQLPTRDSSSSNNHNNDAFDSATFSTRTYPLQRVESGPGHRSASVFGDGDGIPMRRGSYKSLTTMSATDNLDFLLLGPLNNELTPEQRVRETILAGFGRNLADDETRSFPFVPYISGSRRRLRIPVDVDGENVLDAELHLQGINAQALEHLDHNEIDEALDLFESALRSHREKYGQLHHLVGSALHNIGIIHLFAGRYSLAHSHFQEAANVRSAAMGAEHPDVAASMLKISMILMAAGDLHGAHATLLQILQVLRSSLGSGHAQVAKVLNNLGVVEFELGAIAKAFSSFEEAHDIQCRLGLGLANNTAATAAPQRHEFAELAVANTLSNLGFLYAKQSKFSDAARMFLEAFRLQSKYLHANHPTLVRTSENIEFVQSRVVEQRSQSVLWQALVAGAVPLMSCNLLRSIIFDK